MKNITLTLILSLLFIIRIVSAQSSDNEKRTFLPGLIEKAENRFEKQINLFAQEKLYLHIDKPYYSAGDRIWIKGYLTDAANHSLQSMSRYIYVELINRSDSVLHRIKIKRDSTGFSGHIDLSTEIQPDNYLIRAYSYWMQNAGSDYFFRKHIFIGNTIAEGISSEVTYDAIDSTRFRANITFRNKFRNPVIGEKVTLWYHSGKKKAKKEVHDTDASGKVSVVIHKDSLPGSNRQLEIVLQADSEYKRRIKIPSAINDYELSFFPESGALANDISQMVAFKAIGTDGLSTEISGKVFNSKGEEISDIETTHKGMGKFLLKPVAGDSYYAIVKNKQGYEKKFQLPAGETGKAVLQIIGTNGGVIYKVSNISETKSSTPFYYLMIHCRGNLIATIPMDSSHCVGKIRETDLSTGIHTFSVVDTTGTRHCERLYFIPPASLPICKIDSSKITYEKRGVVDICLSLKNKEGKPVTGSFSMAVTDQSSIQSDTLSDNIVSNLLLTSDLRGYIEDPATYISGGKASREKSDLLMLTQGWRRFDTEDVIRGKFKKNNYYLEIGQAVSGKVLNMLGKPQKKGMVFMISPRLGTFNNTMTDSLGRFLITDVSFPDSTLFIVKAMRGKMFNNTIEIIADKDSFPVVKEFYPERIQFNKTTTMEYMNRAKEKFYTEGGIRMYNLNEVSVVGKKTENKPGKSNFSGMGDTTFDRKKLSTYNASNSILFVLSTMPGVRVSGNEVSILGSSGKALILLDGLPIEGTDELTMMNIEDIEEIILFKGASAAFFGSQGANGVIAITMREGTVRVIEKPNLAKIIPLGYQKPAAFYVPKYEVDSIRLLKKPDLRTTLYWDPSLATDSNGVARAKFYLTDKPAPSEIIVEGITNEGEICRYRAILKNK